MNKLLLMPAAVLCLVALLGGAVVAQPIVEDGLSIFYSFDDFVDEVPDLSGNNINGQIFGNVVPSTDAVRGGGSVFIDSAPDFIDTGIAIGGCDQGDFLACDDIPAELIPTEGFTIATWVKVEDSTGGDQSFYQTWSRGGSFVTHGQLQGNGKIRMRLRGGDSNNDNINATDQWFIDGIDGVDSYPIGEWFHIAGTYDMAANQIRFYYNGEMIVDIDADGSAGNIEMGDWGQAAVIGIVPDSRGRQLYGRLDDYYVFHRAISEEEVGLLYGLVEPGGPPKLEAGDANMDLEFNQLDLVSVQIAAKYLTGEAATWGEGDWDQAPGGSPGNPPPGDGLFNQLDIIKALNNGLYLQGPYAAIITGGTQGDDQTSVTYNATTGEVGVDAPAGQELTSINIDSAMGMFTGEAAQNLGGSFDNDADNNIFKATFGSSFGSLSFGNVAQPGLSEDAVVADLTVVGSLAGGGDLGAVDLIYIPEPATLVLLLVGFVAMLASRRRPHRG